jgi:acetyltransferase-like isoleucine patch superfamily enzyme
MGRITMGRYSYGNIKIIGQRNHVYVGKFTSIADNVSAMMVGHNPSNVSTFPFNKLEDFEIESKTHPIAYGDLHIGNDCWVGYGSMLFGGNSIGDGSIIAANSVITKNIEPYSIYGGNPARLIKKRFSEEIINQLLKIKWWEWEENKIRENAKLICSIKIEDFLKIHGV